MSESTGSDGVKIYQRFLLVLTCFCMLFLSFAKDESLAACTSEPVSVKVAGHSYTSTSIQDAYNYASNTLGWSSFTLLLAGEIFTENLTPQRRRRNSRWWLRQLFYKQDLDLKCARHHHHLDRFTHRGSGARRLAVVSTDQCAFDRDADGYTSHRLLHGHC